MAWVLSKRNVNEEVSCATGKQPTTLKLLFLMQTNASAQKQVYIDEASGSFFIITAVQYYYNRSIRSMEYLEGFNAQISMPDNPTQRMQK